MTKKVIYNANRFHDIKVDHNLAQQLLTRFDGIKMTIEHIGDLDFGLYFTFLICLSFEISLALIFLLDLMKHLKSHLRVHTGSEKATDNSHWEKKRTFQVFTLQHERKSV